MLLLKRVFFWGFICVQFCRCTDGMKKEINIEWIESCMLYCEDGLIEKPSLLLLFQINNLSSETKSFEYTAESFFWRSDLPPKNRTVNIS